MASSEQVTGVSVKDVLDDINILTGNRGEEDRARLLVWLKHAITTMANIHHYKTDAVVVGNIDPDDSQYVPIPENTTGVISASYKSNSNSKKFGRLQEGSIHDLSTLEDESYSGEPEKFILIGKQIWVTPRLDEPYALTFGIIKGPPVVIKEDMEFPIDYRLIPACVTLASALFLTSIGESEAASQLKGLTSLMGSTKYGPQAIDNTKADHRVIVRME